MPRRERPLAPGDGPVLRFAADLRSLRQKAGNPPYRELAVRTHFSVSSLSEAAAGRKLPSLAVTLAYVRACEGDVEAWRTRWREVAAQLAESTAEQDPDEGARAPYAGLAVFQPEDADRFFGREDLVETVRRRLASGRLVAVFGVSGSGKSSLLRAGLVPRLRAEEPGRPVEVFTPGAHPLREYRARASGADAVLVIDQFEEVFTLCEDRDERAAFIDALVRDARSDGGVRVVLGVRADFYPHCARHANLVEVIQDGQVTVGPMRLEELRRAITLPAQRAGYTLQGSLLATLMTYGADEAAVLPLLSHALLETWRRRQGRLLTLEGFHRAGGIDGALAQTAERIHDSLDPHRRALLKALFLRLAAPGEGTEDTKRRVGPGELDTDDPAVAELLERLTAARLVSVGQAGVEMTHEALIRSWPRLRDWLDEDREALRAHRRLTGAAEAWEAAGRDDEALYRGSRLAAATDLVAGGRITPSGRERAFLDAGVAAEAEQRALAGRRTRRLRWLAATLAALSVVASTATVQAIRAQDSAERQRNIALSQKVAGQAATLRATNPALAAQLSLAAYRLSPTTEARSSLLGAFAAPYGKVLAVCSDTVNGTAFAGPDGRTLVVACKEGTVRAYDVADPHRPGPPVEPLLRATDAFGIATGRAGTLLAVGGADGLVRLWDITDLSAPVQTAVVAAHAQAARAVAFDAAGTSLVTASADGTARVYDVTDPRNPVLRSVLTGHRAVVSSVAFSPDGRTVATGSWDHTARLWDVAGGQPVVLDHAGPVTAVAFSPTSRTLATAGQDRTTKLWDLARPGSAPGVLTEHNDIVRDVTFSPDGSTLATTGADRTARLWHVTGPASAIPLLTLPGHTNAVTAARFSADGKTLVTAGDDRTVRLWDVPGPVLVGHTDSVFGVAHHPNGTVVATAGRDGAVRLWSVEDPFHPEAVGSAVGHTDIVRWVAFSQDGRTLATTGHDRTVRLWDVGDVRVPRPLAVLTDHTADTVMAAFSPDGRHLATTGEDRVVRLWDVGDRTRPATVSVLTDHTDGVLAADFSRDGRLLVTAGRDRTAILWDVGDLPRARRIATLTGHADAVTSARISPDGTLLATAGLDMTARLWHLGTPDRPRHLATLTGHSDAVFAAVFSPDNRTLATTGADLTTRLWSLDDPARPAESAVLTGHTEVVFLSAFHPDGKSLTTIGKDRTARLWPTDPEQVATRVCDIARPTIDRAEWERFFPGLDYRPPCGK